MKDYDKAVKQFFKVEFTKDYSLRNIKKAVKLLNNPQNNYKIIHIAWTNWKGSVSKMVFSILKKAFKNVWVFTSPHLIDIRERFETSDGKITKKELLKLIYKINSFNINLSYFDRCVIIALEFFRQKKCEYVIFEVWVW